MTIEEAQQEFVDRIETLRTTLVDGFVEVAAAWDTLPRYQRVVYLAGYIVLKAWARLFPNSFGAGVLREFRERR